MWLVECWASNPSANFATCSGHPLLQKPELLGWDPPPPPSNKHNRFQYTVPSHTKSCMGSFGGKGGPRQKARLFVTEGIMAKKAQIQ